MTAPIGNKVFQDVPELREVWTLSGTADAGTAVMDANFRPGVVHAPTPGLTKSATFGPYTVSGIPVPTNGQGANRATVETTGTWEFATTGGSGSTVNGTPVYAVVSGHDITSLTTTASTNKKFGVVNFPEGYVQHDTVLPVKIGVSF